MYFMKMYSIRNGLVLTRSLTRIFSTELPNFYQILGVKSNATQDEIKTAYYAMSKRYHPDKLKGLPDIEKRFHNITQAYEVLGNENLRKKYDSGTLDLSNIPIKRTVSSVVEEPRFRDRSSTIVGVRPHSADFQHWARSEHERVRMEDFQRRQSQAKKKQNKEEGEFAAAVQVLVIAVAVLVFWISVYHPFQDKPESKRERD